MGKGRFIDDIASPGALHAAFVRSPHPHAVIRRIDTRGALALPGVHAVLTLDDLAPVLAQRRTSVCHRPGGLGDDVLGPVSYTHLTLPTNREV